MGTAQTENVSSPFLIVQRGHGNNTNASECRASHSTSPAKALDSNELLQGHKMVAIEHNGALYRLQATKLGKLILTK